MITDDSKFHPCTNVISFARDLHDAGYHNVCILTGDGGMAGLHQGDVKIKRDPKLVRLKEFLQDPEKKDVRFWVG